MWKEMQTLPPDGRQSETAPMIARGVRRLLRLPLEAGLIVADPYGAEIVREAELKRMAPASRRALLLRFAQAAADRLHRLADPART